MRAVLLVLLLSGCAQVNVEKTGEDWDISYKVLWRNIEDVEARVGDTVFRLGKANSDDPVKEIMLDNNWILQYQNPDVDR